jgi:hypothetical protein
LLNYHAKSLLSQGQHHKMGETGKKPNCPDEAFTFNANIHDCLKQPKPRNPTHQLALPEFCHFTF